MLKAIQNFFTDNINLDHKDVQQSDRHKLQVATGALFIEMMRMDAETSADERDAILNALQAKFDLTTTETQELVELSEAEATDAIDYHQFTSLIKQGFSAEQKQKVVEYLWVIAMSDGAVDKHEEYLVRKIAGLIDVPHAAFIAAKQSARDGGRSGVA